MGLFWHWLQIPPSEKTDLYLFGPDTSPEWTLAKTHQALLFALTPTANLVFSAEKPSFFGSSSLFGPVQITIPIPQTLRNKEKARLEKEREKLLKLAEGTQAKLANEEFRAKAPQEVVAKLEQSLAQTNQQLVEITGKLEQLL